MVFSSLLFLYAFLPVFLALYYLAPSRMRNGVALAASLIFYVWGEPVFAVWLVVSSLGDFLVSLWLVRLPATAGAARRGVLALGLVINLAALLYCKYSNFLVGQFNVLLVWRQAAPLAWSQIALPIGISFFTFHKISYLVDIYRGTSRPTRNVFDYLLYICLFPQLIAGPIIRFHDIEHQLRGRDHPLPRFLAGVWRFLLGLGRKVLIANPLGLVADKIFGQDLATLPAGCAWTGILCYAFQIYFDFAGYSDMALGLARMMGFEFLENFNRPYTARSITEFWHRWHISLSNFMRDYLYIPLGGNRVAAWRNQLNLWLTFLVSGFWHGAGWNFIFWGAYHGTLLSVEKTIGRSRLARVPGWLAAPATFLLVLVGWVFFRADSLPHAMEFIGRMLAWDSWGGTLGNPELLWPDLITRRTLAALGLAALTSFIPDSVWQRGGWDDPLPGTVRRAVLRVILAAVLLLLASASLANSGYNPFIYFRF
jgi:alginate O-acetyltransferase complex protein AlgI